MSDFLVIRIPFDKPSKPQIVEYLPNVPIGWKEYLRKLAKQEKKKGRYVVANIMYNLDYFYPPEKKKIYKKIERKTEGKP